MFDYPAGPYLNNLCIPRVRCLVYNRVLVNECSLWSPPLLSTCPHFREHKMFLQSCCWEPGTCFFPVSSGALPMYVDVTWCGTLGATAEPCPPTASLWPWSCPSGSCFHTAYAGGLRLSEVSLECHWNVKKWQTFSVYLVQRGVTSTTVRWLDPPWVPAHLSLSPVVTALSSVNVI